MINNHSELVHQKHLGMPDQVFILTLLFIHQAVSQEGVASIPASALYGDGFNKTYGKDDDNHSQPNSYFSSRMPD